MVGQIQAMVGFGRKYSEIGTFIAILKRCVHKLNSWMFYTAELGGISLTYIVSSTATS